jgi:hypothetical protein
MESYAVTWREADGATYSGRLELTHRYVRLEGGNSTSGGARHVAYRDIVRIGMARSARERIDGRPTLLLERETSDALLVAAVGQPGALAEIAERLAPLVGGRPQWSPASAAS